MSVREPNVSYGAAVNRPAYRTDPITEALCEFQLGGDRAVNLERAHAMVRSELRNIRFGGEVQQQQIRTMNVVLPLQAEQGPPAVELDDQGKRLRALSSDGTRLFMVGAQTLSVHALKPYPGWEEFRSLIADAVGIYRSLDATCPEVRRIGLRYINQVTLPANAEVTDFFTGAPRPMNGLGIARRGFVQRVEHHDGGELHCVVGLAARADPGGLRMALDIDVILTPSAGLSFEDAIGRIESLKAIERDAFEGSITDAMRQQLNAGGT